jgi:hypothetical protein
VVKTLGNVERPGVQKITKLLLQLLIVQVLVVCLILFLNHTDISNKLMKLVKLKCATRVAKPCCVGG